MLLAAVVVVLAPSGHAWCQDAMQVAPKIEDGTACYNAEDWGVESRG